MACITYKVMSCELECTIYLMRVALCSSDVMYKKFLLMSSLRITEKLDVFVYCIELVKLYVMVISLS